MFSSEVFSAIQRLKELQALEADVAHGRLEISNQGRAALVFRVAAAQTALRAKIAGDYLAALDRVNYLSGVLSDLSGYGINRDLNFVGEILRRLVDARENLKAASATIKATVRTGVI